MNRSAKITPQDIERIKSLPIDSFKVGDMMKRGHYDESAGLFYAIDEKGDLTGQVGQRKVNNDRTNADAAPQNAKKKTSGKESKKNSEKESGDESSNESAKKKKLMYFAAGLIIVAVFMTVMFFIIPGMQSSGSDVATDTTGTMVTSQRSDDDKESANNTINVVQAVQEILKGDIIKEDMLRQVAISDADYNRLIVSGGSPAMWEDAETIIGMYAKDYIKADQYINDTDVSIGCPLLENPWVNFSTEEYSVLTLPVETMVTENVVFLGAMCNLDITRELTSVEETTPPEEDEETDAELPEGEGEVVVEDITAEVEGLTMEEALSQSYTVTAYHVKDVVICDILNDDGDSIYPYLAQYIELPATRQLSLINELRRDEEFVEDVEAHYVVVLLTSGQQDVIGDISEDDVVLSMTGEVDANTPEKELISSGLKSIVEILATELVEEE